ncbi:AraC family transcriptional regulator [Flavihumibacter solisilvae]|uniref:HTH araC/xylS-type domain-containing protein n=1 Tax=Flavihumibacter solisilvae TaxID=1349421 RepID=A0A0C1ILE3_9BACT|nr:helix-turn-helix domain-containing protein [Flavihumibacter solisilvae]KIC95020.1 hypothetical protein OI18_09060 [Flavihumibacter solisilvae]
MKVSTIIPLHKMEQSDLPFRLQTIRQLMEVQDENTEDPHYHNYYEMIWVINGKGTLYVDLVEHPVSDNMIVFLKPDQAHKLQAEKGMRGYILSFTDAFFNMGEYEFDWNCQATLSQFFFEHHAISIPKEMETDLEEIFLKMEKEIENEFPFRIQMLKRYFRIFLIYLTRQLENSTRQMSYGREAELVKQFLETVDRYYKEKKLVSDYAGKLLITPNHLNRIVKKNTTYSAGHHIRQRVVLEAKRMARYSTSSMKEIAYSLGFQDTAHFSRFFKEVSGMNFSDFKKAYPVIQTDETLKRA